MTKYRIALSRVPGDNMRGETPMDNYFTLGKLGDLQVTARTSALAGTALLFVVLLILAIWLTGQSIVGAIVLALLATLLHWVCVIFHQMGHARAARRTGYPMTGMEFWWVLSASIYPLYERPLPASTHTRRALGGPQASLLLSAISAIILLLMPGGTAAWWLALFFFADNFLTFTIGSLLPLGFTDGSTLLEWWGKRDA